ncbi:hypothetical protein CsSME_00037684 [Camellia sinensis var. sinensis]
MLSNFGFGSKWVNWIYTCISSTKISVLVNGSPIPKFFPKKGLRQGDPLSPFLFNVVAKGLNLLLTRAKNLGLVKGITIGFNGINISHLQFADDTIIFCETEWPEVLIVKRILKCFEIISGLRINFHKSVICGIGIPDDIVQTFASRLNCTYQKLPLKYLGMPLGANPSRRVTSKPVVEKFKKKLTSWKMRLLSFASRVTLIRSVLSSLPVYYMYLLRLPSSVRKEIDKIQAAFLWRDFEVKKKSPPGEMEGFNQG